MENTFCKIENYNKDQFILTDKYKQPLQCRKFKNSCFINNIKQVIDDPTILNKKKTEDSLFDDTKIPCTIKNDVSELIDKSKINFNIYNIATVNKDIVIKTIDDKQNTVNEIEKKYDLMYDLDKDNIPSITKFKKDIEDMKGQEPSNEFKLNFSKARYDYKQKLLIKENTTEKFGFFSEIFSSPPVINSSNLKKENSKYMKFTYNINTDTEKKGQTDYTITLNDDYEYMVDILIVGGGGGGGGSGDKSSIIAGGGGAGGIVYIVNKKLDAGTYKIIVGNGGAKGSNGYDSMITSEDNNIISLDRFVLKSNGGEKGLNGIVNGVDSVTNKNIITGGNGGGSGGAGSTAFIEKGEMKATVWDGKSYVVTGFKGASGGINYSGGGAGSSNDGIGSSGGTGYNIDITGESVIYGFGGGGSSITSSGELSGGKNYNTPGSGGSGIIGSSSLQQGNPGIVIISYRSRLVNYDKKIFCKVEDSNKNKYILTDKYKQPLNCIEDKCMIFDIKKAMDIKEPEKTTAFINSLYTDTKNACKSIRNSKGHIIDSEPLNKSNINFDNYNIASINKNIVIINKDNEKLTPEQIENNFLEISEIDKNNEIEIKNAIDFKSLIKKDYDYKQKLLIEEDISKIKIKPHENASLNVKIDDNFYMYLAIVIGIFFLIFFLSIGFVVLVITVIIKASEAGIKGIKRVTKKNG
jgi:hypothetical protein